MKQHKGFIALTSVLILSAIFLSVSISIASRAISGGGASIALYERDKAKFLSLGCMDYALMELQRTLYYEGDEGILINGDLCTIRVIGGTGNEDRTVEVESVVGLHTYRSVTTVEEISPDMATVPLGRVVNF